MTTDFSTFSPAAIDAWNAAVDGERLDLKILLSSLTHREDLSASRVLARLSVTHDAFADWMGQQRNDIRDVESVRLIERLDRLDVGIPRCTAALLIATLLAVDDELLGFGAATRREFRLLDGDLIDASNKLEEQILAEIACLLLSTTAAAGGRPLIVQSLDADLHMFYSITLESVLGRAASMTRHKGESIITSASLMTATTALLMTRDLREFLDALGLSGSLLGADSARTSREPGRRLVHVHGPGETGQYVVSEVVAAVLDAGATLADMQETHVLSLHHLVLAQLAIPTSRLGGLVSTRLPAGVSPIDLYPRYIDCAGLRPLQLQSARDLWEGFGLPSAGVVDDVTPRTITRAIVRALLEERETSVSAGPAALLDVAHPRLRPMLDRWSAVQANAGRAEVVPSWNGDIMETLEELLARLIEPEPVEGSVAEWNALLDVCAIGESNRFAVSQQLGIGGSTPQSREPAGSDPLAIAVRAKRTIQAAQSHDPLAQRWAASVDGGWERLAVSQGLAGRWAEVAASVMSAARVHAQSVSRPRFGRGRRLSLRPTIEFVDEDLDRATGAVLAVAFDDGGAVATFRSPDGTWTGNHRSVDVRQEIIEWRTRWDGAVDSGEITASLRDLLDLSSIDRDWLRCSELHLVVSGLALATPIAHAVAVATGGLTWPLVHVAGALSNSLSSHSPMLNELGECCVVEEPPLPGQSLPFASIETDLVSRVVNPGAVLAHSRASRSWVQRVVATIPTLSPPSLLHFTGHGTFAVLPNGQAAACMVLADGELLTPNDLLAVEADVRVLICSACDLGTARRLGNPEMEAWPLAAISAGIEWVVAASWPVDDAATTLLMARLYKDWAQGSDLHGALSSAAAWLRTSTVDDLLDLVGSITEERMEALSDALHSYGKTRPFDDPEFWAPFALYGA